MKKFIHIFLDEGGIIEEQNQELNLKENGFLFNSDLGKNNSTFGTGMFGNSPILNFGSMTAFSNPGTITYPESNI